MPSTPEGDHDAHGRLWRSKARSLDLGGRSRHDSRERSQAAAWMWHMHMSTAAKNESVVQYAQRQASDAILESKRRSSCDRRDSRFRQEASNVSSSPLMKASQPTTVWDCGSKLYDTFELVSFSNRLDRSLLGVPASEALNFHHAQSPFHHAGVLRTLSLPHTLSLHSSTTATSPHNNCELSENPSLHESLEPTTIGQYAPSSSVVQGLVGAAKSKSSSASRANWLTKFVKDVLSFYGQMWCFKSTIEREETITEPSAIGKGDEGDGMSEPEQLYCMYEEKVKEGHGDFHHHHYHYHHHFLHQLDQSATQNAEARTNAKPSYTESARLSFEAMSKICADENLM